MTECFIANCTSGKPILALILRFIWEGIDFLAFLPHIHSQFPSYLASLGDKINKIHSSGVPMHAILALEDGRIFSGRGHGAKGECCGEVVFNTSLTGYQEIFTDPSYLGQIVVLTNPQIGNYGTNHDDNEAMRPHIEGLVVREFSPISSNWRSQQVADEYLEKSKVPVISDIDTRALVRHCEHTA